MDEEYINSFVEAVYTILPSYGIQDLKITSLEVKEIMFANKEITAVIGLTGSTRGNISYSFDLESAKNFVSAMMMGMPVDTIDEDARSAMAELSNQITGRGCKILSDNDKVLSSEENYTDFTTPTFVIGKDVYFQISTVRTLAINVECSAGQMQVNIGLEM